MDYLAHLAADSSRFGEMLASVEPDRNVPSCPAWTASDLLWHLTEVQAFWRTVVEERATAPRRADVTRPGEYAKLLDLFSVESQRLQSALAATGPATAVWTWSSDQSVAFVRRRQAHEALIHRVDAELTAGAVPGPATPDLGADGVDEIITVMMSGVPDWATFAPNGSIVGIETTDVERRWVLKLGVFSGTSPDSGKVFDAEPAAMAVDAEPNSVLRGEASDLDFWLWGRSDSASIEGDTHDVDRLRLLAAVSTQ